MARIRSINPDAWKSEKLAACSAEAERCYWRLQPQCDDHGRAEDDPRVIRSFCFPLNDGAPHPLITTADVSLWLQELHDRGLIVRYTVASSPYLQVIRWGDYQHPQKPSRSKIPSLENADRVGVREWYASTTAGSGVDLDVGEGVVGDSATGRVVELLGRRDLAAARSEGRAIRSVGNYLRACIETRRFVDGETALRILDEHPDWTTEQVADQVDRGHQSRLSFADESSSVATIDGRTFLPGTGWV